MFDKSVTNNRLHKVEPITSDALYSVAIEEGMDYFFFDHVHIFWNNQINLHRQDSWEISYVITGRGVRVIGDTVEPFSQGEVVLIPPNIPHCWSFDETVFDNEGKIENITITFSDRLLTNLNRVFPALFEMIAGIQANGNAISFLGNILSELQDVMRKMMNETDAQRTASLIRVLCLVAERDGTSIVGKPVTEDRNTKRKQSIFLYVMNNYQHNIMLDDVARFAGMEKSAFCVFFKKMTGKPFFTFLIDYRIEASCQMLLKTTQSIAEICMASGFKDVPYYNRVFRKMKNMTPSEYRKKGEG